MAWWHASKTIQSRGHPCRNYPPDFPQTDVIVGANCQWGQNDVRLGVKIGGGLRFGGGG